MEIKLHLGAFDRACPGWLNTDVSRHIYIARVPGLARVLKVVGKISDHRYRQHRDGVFSQLKYLDITKPLPFIDGSVTAVYSSHVMEHLFPDEVVQLIGELFRVLIPGGVCRVLVPNLDDILRLYKYEDPSQFLHALFEADTRKKSMFGHHTAFTAASLRTLFSNAGFKATEICEFKTGKCPDIQILDQRSESLCFEAIR